MPDAALWQDLALWACYRPLSGQGFALPDTTLRTYSLEEMRGKVVLLVYWALY